MAHSFLSLGSNIENRLSYIQQSVAALSINKHIKILKSSSFYETEPWGVKEQNWFLNAAIYIQTELEPLSLLKTIQSIENQLGRNREKESKWHERTIDIDILSYDDKILSIPNTLTIPHPYMHLRAFVLVPMLEIGENFVHPILKKNISELYDELLNPEDVFLYGTILPK